MQPSSAFTRLDLGMTVSEFDLRADRLGFVGSRVFRPLVRNKPDGQFPKLVLERLLQTRDTARDAKGAYPRSEETFAPDTYSTRGYGHEAPVDDRLAAAYGDMVNAEMYESERITDIVLRAYEVAAAALGFNATAYTAASQTTAVTNEWDDATNATPLDDVDAARENFYGVFGQEPNALVINRYVFRNLRKCDSIIDRIKGQGFVDVQPGRITESQVAAALDIDNLIVAGSAKNTANPAQSRSIARIWGNEYALLCRIAETDNPAEPCVGRTIVWGEEGAVAGDQMSVIMEEYRDEVHRKSILRARTDYAFKYSFLMGWLLSNITT